MSPQDTLLGRLWLHLGLGRLVPNGADCRAIAQAISKTYRPWLPVTVALLGLGSYCCVLIQEQLLATLSLLREQNIIPLAALPEVVQLGIIMCWSLLFPATISLTSLPLRLYRENEAHVTKALLQALLPSLVASYQATTLAIARSALLALPLLFVSPLLILALLLGFRWWLLAPILLLGLWTSRKWITQPMASLAAPWIAVTLKIPPREALTLAKEHYPAAGTLVLLVLAVATLSHCASGSLFSTFSAPTLPATLREWVLPLASFYLPWLLGSPFIAQKIVAQNDRLRQDSKTPQWGATSSQPAPASLKYRDPKRRPRN